MTKIEIQEKICELIYRAETFLKWSDRLHNLYEKEWGSLQNNNIKQMKFYNNPITKYIILHNVLYFQEAVVCLHTLLEERNPPVEISFTYYFFNIGKDALENKINNIRNEYRNAHLNKFRNQLIAHKQASSAGDPITGFLNPIKKEHIEKVSSIINKLRSLTNINFNCPANNYFEGYYKPSFEIFYKSCEEAFKKAKL